MIHKDTWAESSLAGFALGVLGALISVDGFQQSTWNAIHPNALIGPIVALVGAGATASSLRND